MKLPSIVLVHGAFHGGWCWKPVADRLRADGFEVFTPTQTGLGERRHLLKAATDMTVFVDDISNLLDSEALDDVVLVGHSYGARSITGAADRFPSRVRRLIYLDGGLPLGGLSRLDAMPQELRTARIAAAEAHDGGLSVPVPPAANFHVVDPVLAAWMDARLTPQPLAVERTALTLNLPVGAGRPVTYVRSTDPAFAGTEASAAHARSQAGWRYLELAAGHNAIVTHPQEIAELIAAEALITAA